jgi:hypothetical protein
MKKYTDFKNDSKKNLDLRTNVIQNNREMSLLNVSRTVLECIRLATDLRLQDPPASIEEIQRKLYESFDGKLDFVEASQADYILTGHHASYWRAAYGNPREGQVIDQHGMSGIASDVGIFTFNITEKTEDNKIIYEGC